MTTGTSRRFREEISTVAAERCCHTSCYVGRLVRTQLALARKSGRDWIIDEEAPRAYPAQP